MDGARLARLRAVEDEESDPVPLDVSAVWNPNPPVEGRPTYDNGKSPQELFWDIDCDEVLYGGGPGGGESARPRAAPRSVSATATTRTAGKTTTVVKSTF